MSKVLVVLGLAAVGTGIAVAVNASAAPADDAGPTPPDSDDSHEFEVTGRSGTPYLVKFVKAFDTESGHQTFYDVMTPERDRLVRYTQMDDDQSSRAFISTPRWALDPEFVLAASDFGVDILNVGDELPNVVLASDVATVPGQIIVMPGEYLATVAVPFPKSLVVSASLIKAALQERGFRQVAVFTEAPADWPISKSGDYFIQSVWDRNPTAFLVPPEVVDLRSRSLA